MSAAQLAVVQPAAARPAASCRRGLLPLFTVAALLLAAACLAPEQPAAQAEICTRHNGVAACRVW